MKFRNAALMLAFALGVSVFAPSPGRAAVPCGLGTFSATGMEPCQPAPVGHFVDTIGATTPTPAPLGSFVDSVGQPFATQAAAGFYVDTIGASFQKVAPSGHFSADSGVILPGAVAPGFFSQLSFPGTGIQQGTPCQPGTASRGGAAICLAVPNDVPTAIGPEFGSTVANGTSGDTYFGRLDIDGGTSQTSLLTFDFTVTNEATDYGLESDALSSDLTLVSAVFRGDDPGLFQLDGFTPGMVLGEGESADFTLRIDPFFTNVFNTNIKNEIMTALTFRTDQGNQRGFDPIALGFDPSGVEAKYQQFREAGGPLTIGGGTTNLSREFTFEFRAGIPEPSTYLILSAAIAGLIAFRKFR